MVTDALALPGERCRLCPGQGARWARQQHRSPLGNPSSLAAKYSAEMLQFQVSRLSESPALLPQASGSRPCTVQPISLPFPRETFPEPPPHTDRGGIAAMAGRDF